MFYFVVIIGLIKEVLIDYHPLLDKNILSIKIIYQKADKILSNVIVNDSGFVEILEEVNEDLKICL